MKIYEQMMAIVLTGALLVPGFLSLAQEGPKQAAGEQQNKVSDEDSIVRQSVR